MLENSLLLIKSAAQVERDANRRHVTPITVVNGRTIRVAAVALHGSGRPFANASSMNVRWDLVGCNDLADWAVESSDSNNDLSGWERNLVLGHVTGEVCFSNKTGMNWYVFKHFTLVYHYTLILSGT